MQVRFSFFLRGFVSRLGRKVWNFLKEPHQACSRGAPGPRREELGGSLHSPTLSTTAAAIHWFSDTPSSLARLCVPSLTERGSFKGFNRFAHGFILHPIGYGNLIIIGVCTKVAARGSGRIVGHSDSTRASVCRSPNRRRGAHVLLLIPPR